MFCLPPLAGAFNEGERSNEEDMIALIALAVGMGAVSVWAQNTGKPNPDDEKLQGVWKVVAVEAEGKPVTAPRIASMRITFAKGKLTLGDGRNDEKYEYKLESGKSPKQIDLIQRGERSARTGKSPRPWTPRWGSSSCRGTS